jgi:hypothetical protein
MTWNPTLDNIQNIFEAINRTTFTSSIHLTSSIGTQVHFLDVHIENIEGHLYTHVGVIGYNNEQTTEEEEHWAMNNKMTYLIFICMFLNIH